MEVSWKAENIYPTMTYIILMSMVSVVILNMLLLKLIFLSKKELCTI